MPRLLMLSDDARCRRTPRRCRFIRARGTRNGVTPAVCRGRDGSGVFDFEPTGPSSDVKVRSFSQHHQPGTSHQRGSGALGCLPLSSTTTGSSGTAPSPSRRWLRSLGRLDRRSRRRAGVRHADPLPRRRECPTAGVSRCEASSCALTRRGLRRGSARSWRCRRLFRPVRRRRSG